MDTKRLGALTPEDSALMAAADAAMSAAPMDDLMDTRLRELIARATAGLMGSDLGDWTNGTGLVYRATLRHEGTDHDNY